MLSIPILSSAVNFQLLEQRIFIDFDPVLQSRSELATPIVFAGDFEVAIDFSTLSTSHTLMQGPGSMEGITIYMNSGGSIRIYADGVTILTTSIGGYNDGKLNNLVVTRAGSVLTVNVNGNIDIAALSGPYGVSYIANETNAFNGILANVTFNNNGTLTTFKLDQATGNTENSLELNNSLTYILIPEANRELFQNAVTQWDNISPAPQQLPAIIEIA